ncbi:MAG: RNA-binding protein [Spirochaetales bacterium]|nr:RNA-binding protein [Spirochaetales bacterium]
MENKIYAGNLNFSVTEDELADAFAEFGNVNSVNIIYDKFTNQSKGFAFVEMENEEDAAAAINGLNGRSIKNRELKVSLAKAKEPRTSYNNNRY